MKSGVRPPVTALRARVVFEDEVVEQESVILELPVDEFLALYTLYYVKGDGHTALRTHIDGGLKDALDQLESTSKFAREFHNELLRSYHVSDGVFNRIDHCLAVAREKTS